MFYAAEMGLSRERDGIGVGTWVDAVPIHHDEHERSRHCCHGGERSFTDGYISLCRHVV